MLAQNKLSSNEPTNLGDAIARGGDSNAPALIDLGGEDGVRVFSFRQLDEISNAVGRGLNNRGLGGGDRVAILSANRGEFLTAFLGIMRAGCVAVPLNFKVPREVVARMLRDCDARLIFCDAQRAELCPEGLPKVVFGDADSKTGFAGLLDPGPFAPVEPGAGDPAMFLYTSGSSGTPKGVVLSHQSHLWVVRTRARQPGEVRRVLVAAPLYHMNGLSTCQAAIYRHDTIVLLPVFKPASYIDAIERYKCTLITSVPPMIAMILRERELLRCANLSSVAFIRMGSAPVTQGLINAMRNVFPSAVTANVYGTTEAGPIVFGPHPKSLKQPDLSVGHPHPQVELRLVQGKNMNAAEGVLHVKCPGLMNGYHNQPDATRLVTTHDGFYITNDIFRRDQNDFYFFVGRADDMFVCGGENIYPTEVEMMLQRHPEIDQACVVPIPDAIKGAKPAAFVVRAAGSRLSGQAVKEFALANAAPYQHPRWVWFVPELPLAGTNKVDRKALMKLAASAEIRHEND